VAGHLHFFLKGKYVGAGRRVLESVCTFYLTVSPNDLTEIIYIYQCNAPHSFVLRPLNSVKMRSSALLSVGCWCTLGLSNRPLACCARSPLLAQRLCRLAPDAASLSTDAPATSRVVVLLTSPTRPVESQVGGSSCRRYLRRPRPAYARTRMPATVCVL